MTKMAVQGTVFIALQYRCSILMLSWFTRVYFLCTECEEVRRWFQTEYQLVLWQCWGLPSPTQQRLTALMVLLHRNQLSRVTTSTNATLAPSLVSTLLTRRTGGTVPS
jgi:hypothetical protein